LEQIDRAQRLIEDGYLPKELPIEFTAHSLSVNHEAIAQLAPANRTARLERFSLARRRHERRMLSIPNPVFYVRLASLIDAQWDLITRTCARSLLSVNKPRFSLEGPERGRATVASPDTDLTELRLQASAGHQYVLQADFSRFFASIYTHSIPWALHGKSLAKRNHGPNLPGNAFDIAVRAAQDGQTIGIPVGPDSSHVMSELIASVIDEKAFPKPVSGYRYVDDYFLCFDRESAAVSALEKLADAAREFELELNYGKTSITTVDAIKVPIGLDVLRDFEFQDEAGVYRKELHALFACAVRILQSEENALTFAVRMLWTRSVREEDWDVLESYLLRSISFSQNCLPAVAILLKIQQLSGAPINRDRISQYLSRVIGLALTYNWHSDVVWALWIYKHLEMIVPRDVVTRLPSSRNSFVALVSLDLMNMGLCEGNISLATWNSILTAGGLYGEHWMLAYEGAVKGWLAPRADFVGRDAVFSAMRDRGVSFYDQAAGAGFGDWAEYGGFEY
jgi:hypothetical protein